jgi:hypothetical protein
MPGATDIEVYDDNDPGKPPEPLLARIFGPIFVTWGIAMAVIWIGLLVGWLLGIPAPNGSSSVYQIPVRIGPIKS